MTRIPLGASARLYTAVTRRVSRRNRKQVQPRGAVGRSIGAGAPEGANGLLAVTPGSIVHIHVFATGVTFR